VVIRQLGQEGIEPRIWGAARQPEAPAGARYPSGQYAMRLFCTQDAVGAPLEVDVCSRGALVWLVALVGAATHAATGALSQEDVGGAYAQFSIAWVLWVLEHPDAVHLCLDERYEPDAVKGSLGHARQRAFTTRMPARRALVLWRLFLRGVRWRRSQPVPLSDLPPSLGLGGALGGLLA
jgi:hypothetical protein